MRRKLLIATALVFFIALLELPQTALAGPHSESPVGTYFVYQKHYTLQSSKKTVGVYAGLQVADVSIHPIDSEPFSGFSAWIMVSGPTNSSPMLQVGWMIVDEWDTWDWLEYIPSECVVVDGDGSVSDLQPHTPYVATEELNVHGDLELRIYPQYVLYPNLVLWANIVYDPVREGWIPFITWGSTWKELKDRVELGFDRAILTGVKGEVRVGDAGNGYNRYVWVDDANFQWIKIAFQTREGYPLYPYWQSWTSAIETTTQEYDYALAVSYYGTWVFVNPYTHRVTPTPYYYWTFHTEWS